MTGRTPLATLALLLSLTPPALAGPGFEEVGQARGLPPGPAGRVLFCDLDGDGWPDAVIDKARIYRNVPDPAGGRRFEEVPDAWGLLDGVPTPCLVLFADLDDDGDRDAYLAFDQDRAHPEFSDSGLRNQVRLLEDGRYVPAPASDPALVEPVFAGCFLDYDRDGRLDLATGGNYTATPLAAHPLRLFAGAGGGRFQEVTGAVGLAQRAAPGHRDSARPAYGVCASDLEGDGWPELLVMAYGRQWNLLYRNQAGVFREAGQETRFDGDADSSGLYPEATRRFFEERYGEPRADEPPFRANGNTFDAACADYDNDGDIDVFLAEITHAWAGPSSDRSSLLTNQGPPNCVFERDPEAAPRVHRVPNWNQGDLHAGWLDYDHDGLLDLLLASSDYPDGQYLRLFRQGPPGEFEDVTEAAGLAWWENASDLSLADYDGDGDVDILVGTNHMRMPGPRRAEHPLRPGLYENQLYGPDSGEGAPGWLTVRLEGAGSAAEGANRDGIGARVIVQAGERTLTREVLGGRGHAGHNDALEACFGLGQAERVRLIVRWPDAAGTTQVFEDVAANQALLVRQATGEAVPLPR